MQKLFSKLQESIFTFLLFSEKIIAKEASNYYHFLLDLMQNGDTLIAEILFQTSSILQVFTFIWNKPPESGIIEDVERTNLF